MNKRRQRFISTGVSSILMVFVVLCLITFATLALASAGADYRLSVKVSERATAYYEAEAKANEALARIDGVLLEQYNSSESGQEYEDKLLEGLSELAFAETQRDEQGVRITFSEVIDDTESLEVELAAVYPQDAEEGFYRIEKWQSVSREEWNPDMALPVMQ